MASSYNTRSTTTTMAQHQRHFCIVLTNNPRMIQSAQRMLQSMMHPSTTEHQRQEEQVQRRPQQQHMPQLQMQSLTVPRHTRARRRPIEPQIEQQVPMSAQSEAATSRSTSSTRAYEQEIENDFQAQLQPLLQLYLQKTRRVSPVNSVFDMTNYIQF